jgi:glyoxylase-like metal-dependent hydrolase (beta-lactamase superfamily II)
MRGRVGLPIAVARSVIVFALPIGMAAPPPRPSNPTAPLHARFIGNASVEITDGTFTLLTDFPYLSGAFGYMTYDPTELRPRPNSVCLFTHAHADHFEPVLVGKIGCTVIGPSTVVSKVPDARTIPLQSKLQIGPLAIGPLRTEHGTVEHNSYLVDWSGARLYFTGDTDSTTELSHQDRLDALFITPWLLQKARAAKALPQAARIVIYHHRAGEKIEACSSSCLVPRSGQDFDLNPEIWPRRPSVSPERFGARGTPL